jgi:hypothetical protein
MRPRTRLSAEGPRCHWPGASGRCYNYFIFDLPARIPPDLAGNFVIAELDDRGTWIPLAIGQGHLLRHAETLAPREAGTPTHFHCHVNLSWEERLAEERDLRRRFDA